MRTIDQVYLKGSWKSYYDGFKKPENGDYERDEQCKIFNEILRAELISAQKSGRSLLYDEICKLCDDINTRVYSLNVSKHKEFDIDAIKSAVHGITIAGSVSFVDQYGKSYDFAHMHYYAHIPIGGLTPAEIGFFVEAFSGTVDESWEVVIFTVLRTKIHNYSYILKNEAGIDRLCRNAIYERVNERILALTGVDLGYKISIMDKIKDYFVRRLM